MPTTSWTTPWMCMLGTAFMGKLFCIRFEKTKSNLNDSSLLEPSSFPWFWGTQVSFSFILFHFLTFSLSFFLSCSPTSERKQQRKKERTYVRWTDDELASFEEGVKMHGYDYHKIAEHVQSKTKEQVRSKVRTVWYAFFRLFLPVLRLTVTSFYSQEKKKWQKEETRRQQDLELGF